MSVADTGEQLYRRQCASCHGNEGQGTKEYSERLEGKRSLDSLTRYIERRMPKDDEEKCVGEDAKKVATYIFDAFYSEEAQIRNQPPRVALARLTVDQHQNVLADLIGLFRSAPPLRNQQGLYGEYFRNRRFRTRERVVQRLDKTVSFDFKEGAPAPKINAEEFAVRWTGTLFAPDTDDYDVIIRSENGFRLWLNDQRKPLIDAWVRSGEKITRSKTIKLLGGRHYPLRLEFFKSKRGREKTASISLEWKKPHGTVRVIPSRYLSPNKVPEVFVVDTPFPPDDRSYGWVRGTTVSKEWDQATTDAALKTAACIEEHLKEFVGNVNDVNQAKRFADRFASLAFRRPLAGAEKRFFIERQFASTSDIKTAIKRSVLLTLKSPRFLYQEAGKETDDFVVASRLSFALWNSIPDTILFRAANERKLKSRDEVARQAQRMLQDPRAHANLRQFFFTWLNADHGSEIAKDNKIYPKFTEEIIADLRTSFTLQIEEVLWSKQSDFRQLFLSETLPLNQRLANFYGFELSQESGFHKATLDQGKRAGVLTHPYLMARLAYVDTTSPIHRGVMIARGLLGVTLRPPPDAFTPLPAKLHPNLTTRERVTLQTKEKSCMSCHGLINPLGFPLEQFDTVGRFRERENGKKINVSGNYELSTGKQVTFQGARELAQFLANSEEVHDSFIEQLFHHLVKQPVRAFGSKRFQQWKKDFMLKEFNMQKLIISLAVDVALRQD